MRGRINHKEYSAAERNQKNRNISRKGAKAAKGANVWGRDLSRPIVDSDQEAAKKCRWCVGAQFIAPADQHRMDQRLGAMNRAPTS
jgi:hypothetical protein